MEHRYAVRIGVKMGISVRYGPSGWVAGCVRDVSVNGAYITGARFPLHAPVTLVLDFHGNTDNARMEWPAMVVRTDDSGVGVMYLELETAMADTLRWIIGQLLGDTPVENVVPITRMVPLAVAAPAEEPTRVPQASLLCG